MTFSFLGGEQVDLIASLHEKHFADGWNKNMLVDAFKSGRFFCECAMDSDEVLGLVTYSIALDEADIEGVVTAKEHRRKGVAKLLVSRAEENLKAKGVKKVFLEVREGNIPARTLYESCGYAPVSVRKNYYPDGENAVVMVKEFVL